VAFDKNGAKVEQEAGELGERCAAFVGDVSMRDDCRRAVDLCVERFGAIDVMIHGAACQSITMSLGLAGSTLIASTVPGTSRPTASRGTVTLVLAW